MNRTGRIPRIHRQNSMHHVMIRSNNRQRIFFDEDNFNYFLKILEQSVEKFDHSCLCYYLMTNHVHLVVHVRDDSLSKVMQNINYRYARWFNKKLNRIGHLFQGRYRSLEIQNEVYLINLCRYIHFNPVSAKIVIYPGDYCWSSHHYYSADHSVEWIDCEAMTAAILKKTICRKSWLTLSCAKICKLK